MTVSRVLNNSGYVSPETRSRVEAAAAELNYVPNMLARSFRSKRTDTLALIITDITNPFWTTVARGVEDEANQHGYTVIFCNTDESESKQAQYLSMLVSRRVDGVLLTPAGSSITPVEMLQQQDVEVVVMDRRIPGAKVDVVRSASTTGARILTAYLIDQGHRRIAILSGPDAVTSANERVDGYAQALTEAGIDIDPALIFRDAFTIDAGRSMAQECLKLDPRPTAIFAANNFIAAGALQEIRAANLRVPEDVSVVSFDDLSTSFLTEPFLTVMAQQAYELGKTATQRLLKRIEEPELEPAEIVLSTDLIVRQSVRTIDTELETNSAN
jgi:LacI family transcriptional regulator